jgi:hypothetical protein
MIFELRKFGQIWMTFGKCIFVHCVVKKINGILGQFDKLKQVWADLDGIWYIMLI